MNIGYNMNYKILKVKIEIYKVISLVLTWFSVKVYSVLYSISFLVS